MLDTHALLWAKISPAALSREASAIIADEFNEILVSAASAWEIATKVRLGRLARAEEFENEFVASINESGYTLVAIDAEVALRAGRLSASHKDPFDRVIAAQALSYDIPVLSADAKLDKFGIRRIW